MADGYKTYSPEYDKRALPSMETAKAFYHFYGYDCVARSVAKQQKLTVHQHRATGVVLRVASEMRFNNWANIWNGLYSSYHVPIRKDGTWFDVFLGVAPGMQQLVVINAADIRTARNVQLIDTYCSEREAMISIDTHKVHRYSRNRAGVWMANGTIAD